MPGRLSLRTCVPSRAARIGLFRFGFGCWLLRSRRLGSGNLRLSGCRCARRLLVRCRILGVDFPDGLIPMITVRAVRASVAFPNLMGALTNAMLPVVGHACLQSVGAPILAQLRGCHRATITHCSGACEGAFSRAARSPHTKARMASAAREAPGAAAIFAALAARRLRIALSPSSEATIDASSSGDQDARFMRRPTPVLTAR